MSAEVIDQIRRIEEARGRALLRKDWLALAELLGEALVHVHAAGLKEDKAANLEAQTPNSISRFAWQTEVSCASPLPQLASGLKFLLKRSRLYGSHFFFASIKRRYFRSEPYRPFNHFGPRSQVRLTYPFARMRCSRSA
jgi:hypothetical protein